MPRKKQRASDGAPNRWASQWLESLRYHELPRLPDDELATEEMPIVRLENPPRPAQPNR